MKFTQLTNSPASVLLAITSSPTKDVLSAPLTNFTTLPIILVIPSWLLNAESMNTFSRTAASANVAMWRLMENAEYARNTQVMTGTLTVVSVTPVITSWERKSSRFPTNTTTLAVPSTIIQATPIPTRPPTQAFLMSNLLSSLAVTTMLKRSIRTAPTLTTSIQFLLSIGDDDHHYFIATSLQ